MRLAILSVTSIGKKLAENIKEILDEDPSFIEVNLYHQNVKDTLNQIFEEYDAILGIMASGIMVRNICHLLNSKTSDPAILVMDESSHHIISLISGHLGGANQLAIKLGQYTGAEPIITTATDVQHYQGIDALARKYYWEIENPQEILQFNRAILNGDKIGIIADKDIDYIFEDPEVNITYYKLELEDLDRYLDKNYSYKTFPPTIKPLPSPIIAVLTNNNNNNNNNNNCELLMKPQKMVAGIGSRKGVSQDQVIKALENSMKFLDLPISRIDELATADIKSEEEGILSAAEYLDLKLNIISLDKIKTIESSLCSSSDFVKQNFGVGGICEPAALLSASGKSKLILKKTAYNGVTVAIALDK